MTFAHGNRCGPSSPCSRFLRNRSTRRWVRPTTQHPENEAFRHPRISFAVAFEDDPASHHPTGTLSPSHRPRNQQNRQSTRYLGGDRAVVIDKEAAKGRSSRHFILIPTVPNIQQNRQSTRYLGGDCAVVVEKQRRGETKIKRQFILILIPTVPRNQQNRQSTRYLGRDRAVVVDNERSSEQEDPNSNSSSSSSPPSLPFNKTDNQPAILAGTVQLLSTRREAAKTKIQTAIHPHPHPHRPSQSTKQTIDPLSWRGPCSCCRQREKQQKGRSKQHFILIPNVPRTQQNRQSTRYLGGDRALLNDEGNKNNDQTIDAAIS
ncbi:hypothetical protein MHU86_562 [Fragilaria crotonensis]|nr:hypothetical protein MHU86_562 [Fragilaria crotonensis]